MNAMRLLRLMLPAFLPGLFLIPLTQSASAGSATWKLDPTSGDWNTAANWAPITIPNGTDDIATFGSSNVTEITQSMTTTLGGMVFNPGPAVTTLIYYRATP